MENFSVNIPKNILQIFASPTWGGGEQYVYDLSKKLIGNHHHVLFVQRKSPIIEQRINNINASSFILPLKNNFDIYSILRLSRLIRRENIGLIHTHQFKDAFIAVFARLLSRRKVKIIQTRHLVKKAKTGWLYSWFYKRIDKIIFVSQLAMDEFLSTKPEISRDKVIVIHNSILPAAFSEKEKNIRTQYHINPDKILLGFTGRITPEKGLDILINALSKIKKSDFLMLIAGKGNPLYEQEINDLISSLQLADKIKCLGFLGDAQAFVKQMDIGIAPSVWKEPFGLSIIEFMQAGKPVITTNNGAQPEYITNHYDGILVPPSDQDALAESIEYLIENKETRVKIGEMAKKTFEEKLSYPVFYQKILSVYNEN